MGFLLTATPWLLLLFATDHGTNAETSSEVERLLRDTLRRSSGISENTIAVLHYVEKLANLSREATVKVERILTAGEEAVDASHNVSDWISRIGDDLRVLDDVKAASRGCNITLKKVETSVEDARSLVHDVSKELRRCGTEGGRGLKLLSTSLSQELEVAIKQHCHVGSTVQSVINTTTNTEAVARSANLEDTEALGKALGILDATVTELKKDVGKRLQEIQTSLDSMQEQIKRQPPWKGTVMLTVERVVWHAVSVRSAIDLSASAPTALFKHSRVLLIGGYSARLRLEISRVNDVAWLGVSFTLCAGDNDQFLRWPFMTPLSLGLLHPSDPSKDERRLIGLEDLSGRFLSAVRKPGEKCNAKWLGFPRILKVDAMDKMGFGLDDGLSVAVDLHPVS